MLAGGAKGKRMSLPNSKILIHQVSAGFSGQATDIEIHAREIIDMRRRLDLPAREEKRFNMAVGIEHRGESYGLLIDSVGEVLKIPAASREPNPVNLDPRWSRVAEGVVQLDGRLMVVLDVERVLELKTLELVA